MKLNAKQLRTLAEQNKPPPIKRRPLFLILDNLYDTYNIGGLFRLADALAVEKIFLCGGTETPPNSRIKKASIGTYKIVPWEYKTSATEAIYNIRNTKYEIKPKIIAIEQHPKAIPYTDYNYIYPLALVVGNETTGLSEAVLNKCDAAVEIPMYGVNKSLNVIVSAAIVAYFIDQKIKPL